VAQGPIEERPPGFRGEEEIAFDARPALYAGKFQRITDAVGA
jgi:hypothetical protein